MANLTYTTGLMECLDQTHDLVVDTIKMLLCTSVHVPDRDNVFIDDGGADDAIDGELSSTTNYTGGFGGGGRKALGTKSFVADLANDRVEYNAAAVVWTALGGASNQTIDSAVVAKEITNDALSPVFGSIDTSSGSPSLPFLTTGSDFTLTPSAEGLLQYPTI